MKIKTMNWLEHLNQYETEEQQRKKMKWNSNQKIQK